MLLTRPIHRVFSPKVWTVKKDNTFYGMHVPKYNDDSISETWLLAFKKKNEANQFAGRLYQNFKKRQEWPTRIIEEYLYDWNNYDLGDVDIEEEDDAEEPHKNPLRVVSVNYVKLLKLASLEDITVRTMIINQLGDFTASPKQDVLHVSQQDVVKHLEKLFRKRSAKMIDAAT